MNAVHRDSAGRFIVDLAAVDQRWWRRLLGRSGRVDGFAVARGVLHVMQRCPDRDARGSAMVWNRYRVYLAPVDFEALAPLIDRLERDLLELVQQRVDELGAHIVGPPELEIVANEGGDLAQGRAIIGVSFAPARPAPKADAGATVRVGRYAPTGGDRTTRVLEPVDVAEDALLLSWPGGHARVGHGSRVVVGRAHAASVGPFVPLEGVTERINKRQLFVEATPDGAVIGRLTRANPVQVDGRLVQAGGQLMTDQLPVEISLSDGELLLRLDHLRAS